MILADNIHMSLKQDMDSESVQPSRLSNGEAKSSCNDQRDQIDAQQEVLKVTQGYLVILICFPIVLLTYMLNLFSRNCGKG